MIDILSWGDRTLSISWAVPALWVGYVVVRQALHRSYLDYVQRKTGRRMK